MGRMRGPSAHSASPTAHPVGNGKRSWRVVRARSGIQWAITGICAGLVVVPAAASASRTPTGGAIAPGMSQPGVTAGPTRSTGALASTGALTVAPQSITAGSIAVASGALPAADAGRAVWLQVEGKASWATVASSEIGPGGGFVVSWRPRRTGQLTVRAVSAGPAPKTASAATSPPDATSEATLLVYRQVIATWYGPGFYGQHTACGETMTRWIVGVADRTLPCGTPVSVSYNGHTAVVPVIDRGPYGGNGATLDLTHGAALELGITETVPVGMITLAGPPLAPTDFYPAGTPTGSTGASGATGSTTFAGGATAPAG